MIKDNKIIAGNFKLVLNGTEINEDLTSTVFEVSVEESLNQPTMFMIKFKIGDFLKNIQKEEAVLNSFNIGDEMQISLGFDKPQKITVGEIASIEPTFQEPFLMDVRGYDRLHKLTFGAMSRSFSNRKDSDIASSIAKEYGLTAQADDSKITHPYVFQNNKSNCDFLIERANLIGFEILVDDKTLIFRESQDDESPKLSLQYDMDLQTFSINVKTVPENTKVKTRGWDVKKKQEITHTVETAPASDRVLSQGEMTITISDEVVLDISHAEMIAKAKYDAILKSNITSEGKCGGNPYIRAGITVDIKNVGERFSGAYYITATSHSINEEGYSTTFKARKTGK